jgi:hypothetical protein
MKQAPKTRAVVEAMVNLMIYKRPITREEVMAKLGLELKATTESCFLHVWRAGYLEQLVGTGDSIEKRYMFTQQAYALGNPIEEFERVAFQARVDCGAGYRERLRKVLEAAGSEPVGRLVALLNFAKKCWTYPGLIDRACVHHKGKDRKRAVKRIDNALAKLEANNLIRFDQDKKRWRYVDEVWSTRKAWAALIEDVQVDRKKPASFVDQAPIAKAELAAHRQSQLELASAKAVETAVKPEEVQHVAQAPQPTKDDLIAAIDVLADTLERERAERAAEREQDGRALVALQKAVRLVKPQS